MNPPVILVPLDGSRHALVALPVARGLASVLGAVIHFLHVSKRELPPEKLLQALRLSPEDVRGAVVDQRVGDPAEAILQVARDLHDPVIVMCTHTGLPTPEGPLGIVAERVLLGCSSPVALVDPRRGVAPWELRHVQVPHDGTPATTAAIIPAAELARKAGAGLSVLHVAAPGMRPPDEPGSLTAPQYLDQPQHEWPAWASEFVDRLAALDHLESVPLSLALARGEPAAEVVRHAENNAADLIVLAWHGGLDPKHGGIVKAVLAEAPCPALVLRSMLYIDKRPPWPPPEA